MGKRKRTACEKVMIYLDLKYTGIDRVAEAIGLHRSTGYKWVTEGGDIPQRHWESIIKLAKRHKIKLYKTDLIGD